jgi:hypothetical protein
MMSFEQYCSFPMPRPGDHLNTKPYIDAFLNHVKIGVTDHRLAAQDFSRYYIIHTTPALNPWARMEYTYELRLIGDCLREISHDIHALEPGRSSSKLLWSFAKRHPKGWCLGVHTREESDALLKKIMAVAGFLLTDPAQDRFALADQRPPGPTAVADGRTVDRLAAILGVRIPPSSSPLAFHVRTRWAQEMVFAAYDGKQISHVARAAILEQTFLGLPRQPYPR